MSLKYTMPMKTENAPEVFRLMGFPPSALDSQKLVTRTDRERYSCIANPKRTRYSLRALCGRDGIGAGCCASMA